MVAMMVAEMVELTVVHLAAWWVGVTVVRMGNRMAAALVASWAVLKALTRVDEMVENLEDWMALMLVEWWAV